MTTSEIEQWRRKEKNLEKRLRKLLEADPVDVVAFNAQRKRLRDMGCMDFCNGTPPLYLRNKVCHNIDFGDTWFEELDNVSLDHANLRRSYFDYARVKDTSFRYADLRDAAHLLSKVDIRGIVDFSYADLRGIRLDIDYKGYTQRMIYGATFYQTKITPQQEQQLVTDFGIHPVYMVGRFQITP